MRHRELQSLLIRAGLATGEQIAQAVTATAGTQTSWLEYLVQHRMVAEGRIAELAAQQTFTPLADLDRLEQVPAEVIQEVPWDLAVEHRVVPLGIEPDGDLRVAMLDPCDDDGFAELQFFLGRRILREVAPATAMAWALHRYYGLRSALWPQQAQPARQSQPALRATTQRSRPLRLVQNASV